MGPVLLIRPLCAVDEPEFAEPLGIERIAGHLRAHGCFDVCVLDRRLGPAERRAGYAVDDTPGFFDELRARFADGPAPGIIGLSLMTAADIPDARRIISRLGSWWPAAQFIAGGVLVTTAPAEVARALPVNVELVRGEGEARILELARGAGAGLDGVLEPDQWAAAFRPDLERYARLGCAVNVQSSRGCPGSCAFCATPQLPDDLRRWRPRSISLVVDEMEEAARRLADAGLPRIFNFVDDDFGPLARLEELAEELAARGAHVAFSCEMRLASLAGQADLSERLARLHEQGLTRVFFGVESLDPATLERWRKPVRPVEALPEVLAAFSSAGVDAQAGYILWHAGQTIEGALDEAARLHELGAYSHRAAVSRLIAFPGCALEHEADARGFEPMDPAAEAFHQRFLDAAADVAPVWTRAAVAEPYVAAKAHLTGDTEELKALRRELTESSERSYELLLATAAQEGRGR